MPPSADQRDRGRLPCRLWIGVSGHRTLPDDPRLVDGVRRAVERAGELASSLGASPVRLGVVSALAEGADRLVVREVLRDPEAVLEAVLPLPQHEYVRDFASKASREEFDELLGRASVVTVLPPALDREAAYAGAGRYVDDRSDVLVVVWDGDQARGTGGTAEVVDRRKHARKPLLWVQSSDPYELSECFADRLPVAAFEGIHAYNRARLAPAALADEVGRRSRDLPTDQLDDAAVASLRWWLPYLARADRLARRYQRWHFGLGTLIAGGAALAVAAAAAGLVGERLPWIEVEPSLLEASLLLVLCVALGVGWSWHVHRRWIDYRSLAEQLRAALFLTVAGLGGDRSGLLDRRDRLGTKLDWVGRSIVDLWATHPRGPGPTGPGVGPLRRFLVDAWIRKQQAYHDRAARRHRHRERWAKATIYVLFAATVVVAGFHALELRDDWSTELGYASVVMPALAGAVEAVRAQRQWHANAHRSAETAEALEALANDLERAPDATAIRAVARAAALRTIEENTGWSGLMRFHDLEPS